MQDSLVFTGGGRVAGGLFGDPGWNSGDLPQETPGTYYWTVAYEGDSSNLPSSTACGDQTLTIRPRQPTTVEHARQTWPVRPVDGGDVPTGSSLSVPAGASGVFDVADVGYADRQAIPDGHITFRLYRQAASGPQCMQDSLVFTGGGRVAGGLFGDPGWNSGDLPQEPPGTYYWTVAYEGDSSNLPSSTACGDQTLTVLPFRISPYGGLISNQALTLTMGCTVPPCTVRITITLNARLRAGDARQKAKSKPPVITLARGKVTIRKHGTQTVQLRLTAAGRRFVASHNGQVTVNAALAMTIRGHATVLNQRLKLKLRKPSTRKQR
jgi:hypothetical protein